MTKYRIKPVEEYLAEQKAKQANNTASTAPKQTVTITGSNGIDRQVTAGSQTHLNWAKNNPSAITYPEGQQPTYTTPDVYKYSDNVKQFDLAGNQTYSVSGYTGPTTPTFNVSSNVTNMVNQIKQQEAAMRESWTNKSGNYNDLIRQRNEMSGQLLDLITKESGGNASLGEIESILGRRLENQEMQGYREQFSNGSTLQQQQLNNLWEHDFATRNNGESYQYNLNYLNNGTGGEVLGQSKLDYLSGLSPDALANYTQGQSNSLASTQNYFTQRADGWTPNYVNNTVNPLPWGEVDAADVIDNGGAKLQQQYEDYLWMLQQQQNPIGNGIPQTSYPTTNYPTVNYPTNNIYYTPQIPNFNFTLPQTQLNPNFTINMPNQGIQQVPQIIDDTGGTTPYNTGQASYGGTNNQSLVDKQNELLNKYLQDIFKGGV